jgi:hypothetical protein
MIICLLSTQSEGTRRDIRSGRWISRWRRTIMDGKEMNQGVDAAVLAYDRSRPAVALASRRSWLGGRAGPLT